MRRVLGLLLVVVACLGVFGCSVSPQKQVGTGGHGSLPPSTQPTASEQNIVPLIPYKADGPPDIQFLYPQGWKVERSGTGDLIELSQDAIEVRIVTGPVRGAPPPATVGEMRAEFRSFAPDAEIKQLQVAGTVSAFEAKHSRAGAQPPVTVLWLGLYGTAFNQTVSMSAPADLFPQWEPTFREMLRSFKHSDLDHDPLSGKP